MCELTPKISWTTTSPPRALPLGAARYAPNLNPSSDVRLIISPIVVLSSSWWSAWNERGATARRIHGQREAIEHVTAEEAVDIGQADVVHDHRQRPHAGAGHVEQWHRDLARRRRARHADDVHDAGAAGVEPGPCEGGRRDDGAVGARIEHERQGDAVDGHAGADRCTAGDRDDRRIGGGRRARRSAKRITAFSRAPKSGLRS